MLSNFDIAEASTGLNAQGFKNSYYEFVLEFWSETATNELVEAPYMKMICDELTVLGHRVAKRLPKLYDLVINIPPSTAKTTFCTILYPAWLWIINPQLRVISASYSGRLATAHSTKSRDVVKSDKYKMYYPDIELRKDVEAKTDYQNTAGGQRFTTSVGGTVTGQHADVRILDDPLNPKKGTVSPVDIKTANEWNNATFSTRYIDPNVTFQITVMQNLHANDVANNILNNAIQGTVKHICLPARKSAKTTKEYEKCYVNGFLAPKRLGDVQLKQIERKLGKASFLSQYQQETADPEGNKIKYEWLNHFFEGQQLPSKPIIKVLIDGAYTKNKKNDPTGILVYCYYGGRWYFLERNAVWLELPDLEDKIVETYQKYKFIRDDVQIHIEPKASGYPLFQLLGKNRSIPKDSLYLWQNIDTAPDAEDSKAGFLRLSKEAKLQIVVPEAENRSLLYMEDGNWDDYREQLGEFPNAEHDEDVDNTAYAVALELYGGGKKQKAKSELDYILKERYKKETEILDKDTYAPEQKEENNFEQDFQTGLSSDDFF